MSIENALLALNNGTVDGYTTRMGTPGYRFKFRLKGQEQYWVAVSVTGAQGDCPTEVLAALNLWTLKELSED